ncbi:Bifunctional pinoresinol-lariciresinol reductase [Colletotrichum sp. SAR 10_86]|nr:Bifunctional pinoresinol-lariciresinol reductase [Colletotrichum sp. SAR 10_65]KAI8204988.1 Bifunctional pinoresinol-lariciresinol reductase [Colletotrichum sp. SAR 10_76]KAI8236048.1 Bifunctional pinoresinol-lariciresinol reductase [Colletotrichum sp. SAR 10_86]
MRMEESIAATGTLGPHLLKALTGAGHSVTVIQRKESTREAPQGVKSVKVDLTSFDDLVSVFKGQDVFVSAVPNPTLASDKVIIDAAIAASVKRIIPSEFTTNLDTPLSRKLPHVLGKVAVREYLESVVSASSSTTWTSINNGAFLELCLKFGILGPNLMQKTATFHDGGEKVVGASLLPDIGTALVKILEPGHFEETANKPVYFYSAAISEKMLTRLASEATGIDFGSVEDGRIPNLKVEDMVRDANERLANGDKSAMITYYFPMMYSEGYGGTDFKKLSWNEKLGLRVLSEEDLKELFKQAARELGGF